MKLRPGAFLLAVAACVQVSLADTAADRLIAKAERATKALKGFRFTGTTNLEFANANGGKPYKRTDVEDVLFVRPNRFRVASKQYATVCDGHEYLGVGGKYYERDKIASDAMNFNWSHNDLYLFFVSGSLKKALTPPYKPKTLMLANETWEGQNYKVVQVDVPGGFPIRYKLYFGKDNLVRRIVHIENNAMAHRLLDFSVSTPERNPRVKKGEFALIVPEGVKSFADLLKAEPKLIEVGQVAADFSLDTPDGRRISMSDALKGKKALLLNFWFVQCPPCRAEHPHLNKLYNELKDRGLGMLAIDDQDTAADSAKYLRNAKLDLPTVLTGPRYNTDPKTGKTNYSGPMAPDYASLIPYGVRECPTNIIIGADGKIAYVHTEWDEAGLREALSKLGVK